VPSTLGGGDDFAGILAEGLVAEAAETHELLLVHRGPYDVCQVRRLQRLDLVDGHARQLRGVPSLFLDVLKQCSL